MILSYRAGNESRNDLFESEEKKNLGPLPNNNWEFQEYPQFQAMKYSHIRLHRENEFGEGQSDLMAHIHYKIKIAYKMISFSYLIGRSNLHTD